MQIPVLPGDGIGPEIAAVTVQVLERLDRRFALDLAFEVHEVGLASLKRSGSTLPEPAVAACRAALRRSHVAWRAGAGTGSPRCTRPTC